MFVDHQLYSGGNIRAVETGGKVEQTAMIIVFSLCFAIWET